MHYLKELGLFNTGPVQDFKLPAGLFTEAGNPKPIVLVGANGSGKTIAISTIVDALHEFACAAEFTDVLPMQGAGRKYWRVSGGGINYYGAPTSVSWLTMGEAKVSSTPWTYFDKSKEFSQEEWTTSVGTSIPYPGNGSKNKTPNISNQTDLAKQLFKNSAYCYFPSNRTEVPFWLNKPYESEKSGDGTHLLNLKLGKPIECNQSMRDNAVWLLDVILDDLALGDASRRKELAGWHQAHPAGSQTSAEDAIQLANKMAPNENLMVYANANNLVSAVLGFSAKLSVNVRTSYKRLQYSKVNDAKQLHVSHLSNGQSSLLNIFLTILRYSDDGSTSKALNQIEGVVVIDEADAGLHINFQYEVLPKLMKLMPKVQFILATHSPLLLLGLEKEYGNEGVQIIEMPTGRRCQAEDFSEFKAAYDALEETRKFREDFEKTLSEEQSKPLLMLEGDSDEILIRAAWQKLRPKQPELPFAIHSIKLGRTYLRTILKSVADEGFPSSRRVLALWDFDEAYEDWRTILNTKSKGKYVVIKNRKDSDGLIFHASNNVPCYGALLPVPKFREMQAGEKFIGGSHMPIELLFTDEHLANLKAIETIVAPGGGQIKKLIVNDKIKLANDLTALDAKAFEHFEPLLKMLEEFLLPSTKQTP